MDLADVDNEIMAIDDEDVFCVSSSWSDLGVDSSMVR
jgi:hypothetical protein